MIRKYLNLAARIITVFQQPVFAKTVVHSQRLQDVEIGGSSAGGDSGKDKEKKKKKDKKGR